ncbi:MAG: energy-coupling factor ABC transporter ATP-binding protein [Bacteroidota bacterium]
MIPALDILNLQYSYPDGRIALRGISFSIQEGECVGLIGPNGAGKSTLLLHLNGLLPEVFPDTAAVRVYGVSLSPANVSELRRRVGLLFQDPDDQLFCPTVYEDVAFGPMQLGYSGEQLDTVVAESLRKAGLENVSSRAPHHLSGGERRRVCLAGVLACQPDILVLDEPTSDLDPKGKRELKALLRTLPATKVIATHDLELVVELCPRVIVIDEGKIVADGPTTSLLNDEELMLAHGLERPHILRHKHPH